jgi:hypothetical protein
MLFVTRIKARIKGSENLIFSAMSKKSLPLEELLAPMSPPGNKNGKCVDSGHKVMLNGFSPPMLPSIACCESATIF